MDGGKAEEEQVGKWLAYARAAPPELGADMLLRIESSGLPLGPKARSAILEAAYGAAAFSAEAISRRFAEGAAESLPTFENEAFHLGTSMLSLRSRVVKALIAVDARRARELWSETPLPALKALTCSDAMVYDVGAYYDTWAAVVESAAAAPERDRERLLEDLREHLLHLSSPAQIQPVARLLLQRRGSAQSRATLIDAFSAAIPYCPLDARQFGADFSSIARAVGSLAETVDEAARNTLIRALRTLVVRHMAESACMPWRGAPGLQRLEPFAVFNAELLRRATDATILEVPAENLGTPPAESRLAPPRPYWRDSPASTLVRRAADLRSARGYEHGKDSPEWTAAYGSLLNDIDHWQLTNEPLDAFYYEKTTLLLTMIEMPRSSRYPDGDHYLKDYFSNPPAAASESDAPATFLRFVTNGDSLRFRSERPMLWYSQVRRLLDFVDDYNPPQKIRILASLRRTDDALLQLWADFEQLQWDKSSHKENHQ